MKTDYVQPPPGSYNSMFQKKCSWCRQTHPWYEFLAIRSKKSFPTLYSWCSECRRKKYAQEKADALAWRDHLKSKGKIWYETTAEDARSWRRHMKTTHKKYPHGSGIMEQPHCLACMRPPSGTPQTWPPPGKHLSPTLNKTHWLPSEGSNPS